MYVFTHTGTIPEKFLLHMRENIFDVHLCLPASNGWAKKCWKRGFWTILGRKICFENLTPEKNRFWDLVLHTFEISESISTQKNRPKSFDFAIFSPFSLKKWISLQKMQRWFFFEIFISQNIGNTCKLSDSIYFRPKIIFLDFAVENL